MKKAIIWIIGVVSAIFLLILAIGIIALMLGMPVEEDKPAPKPATVQVDEKKDAPPKEPAAKSKEEVAKKIPKADKAPKQDVHVIPEPAPTLSDKHKKESFFVETVVLEYPELLMMPRKDMLAIGHWGCDVFDQGGDLGDLAVAIAMQTPDAETERKAGFIAGAGVAAFCPEHSKLIDG